MIKALQEAIEKVKKLPSERQELAAEVLEQIAAGSDAPTEDERRLVQEGLTDLDAGRVISDEDMTAFWVRHRI